MSRIVISTIGSLGDLHPKATEIARIIQAEDGVTTACDAIETKLSTA